MYKILLITIIVLSFCSLGARPRILNPKVIIKTTMGDIEMELFKDKAPISVDNFLTYVKDGYYKNCIFHRVIPRFMIQGGGLDKAMNKKETRPPIKNEADNGLKNDRGTISYARRPEKDSATAQFFINLVDNNALNHKVRDFGYAVFGKVTQGMDVVDKIAAVKTGIQRGMRDVPEKQIVILSIKILKEK